MPVYRESSPCAVVLLCVAFIAFGVNWWREGVAAIHSGDLVRFSNKHFSGYETVGLGMLCVLIGAMGIWAVVRQARRPH